MLHLQCVGGSLLNFRVLCSSCCLLICLSGNVIFIVFVIILVAQSHIVMSGWSSFHSFGNPLLLAQSHIVMFWVAVFLMSQCHVLAVSF